MGHRLNTMLVFDAPFLLLDHRDRSEDGDFLTERHCAFTFIRDVKTLSQRLQNLTIADILAIDRLKNCLFDCSPEGPCPVRKAFLEQNYSIVCPDLSSRDLQLKEVPEPLLNYIRAARREVEVKHLSPPLIFLLLPELRELVGLQRAHLRACKVGNDLHRMERRGSRVEEEVLWCKIWKPCCLQQTRDPHIRQRRDLGWYGGHRSSCCCLFHTRQGGYRLLTPLKG
mmetsp:Transcript_14799/g.50439  ORF Transcript_14799/g.50439 Transcript_14799/m.50439 type:complete len:226 (+) Transcript_14799:1486-2163(+)